MNYGEILKHLRKNKGMSQQEIADKFHIDRSTYAKYETTQSQPNFETLIRIADYFDVSIDYLLGRPQYCKRHARYMKNSCEYNDE